MRVGIKQRAWFALMICLLLLLNSKVSHSAEELRLGKVAETVSAPDTAILNIEAPADAEIYIGTENYKDQRKFEMGSLKDGHFYDYQIQIKSKQRVITEKTVQLKAGLNVVLKLVPIDPKPLHLKTDTKKINTTIGALLAFSPDGKYLASANHFWCVVIDLDTKLVVRRFQHHHLGDMTPSRVEFENGSQAIRVYRPVYLPESKQTVMRSYAYLLREKRFTRFRESPVDGKSLFKSSGNGFCEWSITSRQVSVQQNKPPYRSAQFTLPQGLLNTIQTCLTIKENNLATKSNVKNLKKLQDYLDRIIGDASFSDDGNWLALGINKADLDGDPDSPAIPCCIIWDLKQDRLFYEYYDFRNNSLPPSPVPTSVKFSPDSKTLAIGNQELLLFSMSLGKVTERFSRRWNGFGAIALPEDPFSDTVLMSAATWTGVWDRRRGKLFDTISNQWELPVQHVSLSRDGTVALQQAWIGPPRFRHAYHTIWNILTDTIIKGPRKPSQKYPLRLNHDGSNFISEINGGSGMPPKVGPVF